MDRQIKFGICEWVLPSRLQGPSSARAAFDAGLDGVALELGHARESFPLADDYMIRLYQEEQARYGVEFPALACNMTDFFPMTAPRGTPGREMVERAIRLSIKAAAGLNIPVVQIPSFLASAIRSEEDLRQSAECLQYACRLAVERGIIIGTENTLSAEWQMRELELVDCENFKVYFDTQNGHLQEGICLPETVRQLLPYIIQVHLKDGIGSEGSTLMGYGENDALKTVENLLAGGYKGWFIFENEYFKAPLAGRGEDSFALLKTDLESMQAYMKDIETK